MLNRNVLLISVLILPILAIVRNGEDPVRKLHRTEQIPWAAFQWKGRFEDFARCPTGATGHFHYPPDCKRFLNCWKGRGHIQICAPGTLFNPSTRECDHPSKVTCADEDGFQGEQGQVATALNYVRFPGERPPIATNPRFAQQQDEDDSDSEEDEGRRGFTGRPPYFGPSHLNRPTRRPDVSQPKSNEPAECAPGATGHFPHPTDCRQFLHCWSGRTFIKQCGPGTAFNPAISVCDHIYNVKSCAEEKASASTNDDVVQIIPPEAVRAVEGEPKAPSGRKVPPGHRGPNPSKDDQYGSKQPSRKPKIKFDLFGNPIAVEYVPNGPLFHPHHHHHHSHPQGFNPTARYPPHVFDNSPPENPQPIPAPPTRPNPYGPNQGNSQKWPQGSAGQSLNPYPFYQPDLGNQSPKNDNESRNPAGLGGSSNRPGYPYSGPDAPQGSPQKRPAYPQKQPTGASYPQGGQKRPGYPQNQPNSGYPHNGQEGPQNSQDGLRYPQDPQESQYGFNYPQQNPDTPQNGYGHSTGNPSYVPQNPQGYHNFQQKPPQNPFPASPQNIPDDSPITQNPYGQPENTQGNPQSGQNFPNYPNSAQKPTSDSQTSQNYPQNPTNPSANPSNPSNSQGFPRFPQSSGRNPQNPGSSSQYPQSPQNPQNFPSFPGNPQGSSNYPQNPQGSPNYPQIPQGSPNYPQNPQGSPYYSQNPQNPQGSPNHPQNPQGSPNYLQNPQGSPNYPQNPQGSPIYPQNPQGSPNYPQNPQSSQGSPNLPQNPQNFPSYPGNPKGSPNYPQNPQGLPNYPQNPQGSPNYPQNQQGSPNYPQNPEGSPSYPQNPQGSPSYPQNPQGSPSYPQNSQGSPNYPQNPQGSPNNPRNPSYPSETPQYLPSPVYQRPPQPNNQIVPNINPTRPDYQFPGSNPDEDNQGQETQGQVLESAEEGQFFEPDPTIPPKAIKQPAKKYQPSSSVKKTSSKSPPKEDKFGYEPLSSRMLPDDVENVTSKPEEKPAPPSGQNLRLRGGSTTLDGYLEIRGPDGQWGLACDQPEGWNIDEATVVCRKLGYNRGAKLSWQGFPMKPGAEKTHVNVDKIVCKGDGRFEESCNVTFVEKSKCEIGRSAIGVSCYDNIASNCQPGETHLSSHCYSLQESNQSGPGHSLFDAAEECLQKGGHLLDLNTQSENDFISEWLLRAHPNTTSVMTAGVGVTFMGMPMWVWQGTDAPMLFQKWWTGWSGERPLPEGRMNQPACLVMKRKFPCPVKGQDVKEEIEDMVKPQADCVTDYFFWDVEPCEVLKPQHLPFICERPISDIGCVEGRGEAYTGTANTTASGKPCLPWDHPKVIQGLARRGGQERSAQLTGHNFCRNVGKPDRHPWCFVEGSENSEYCDIPHCYATGTAEPSD